MHGCCFGGDSNHTNVIVWVTGCGFGGPTLETSVVISVLCEVDWSDPFLLMGDSGSKCVSALQDTVFWADPVSVLSADWELPCDKEPKIPNQILMKNQSMSTCKEATKIRVTLGVIRWYLIGHDGNISRVGARFGNWATNKMEDHQKVQAD